MRRGGTYTVRLTVTDANGGTGTVTHDVTVTAPATASGCWLRTPFGRTLATGWGSADTGGAWTLSGAANLFGVGGGAGTMSVGAGKAPAAHLNSVASTSTDVTADLSVDKLPNTGSVYVDLIGRGDNANAYRGRVLIRSTGVVEAHLDQSRWRAPRPRFHQHGQGADLHGRHRAPRPDAGHRLGDHVAQAEGVEGRHGGAERVAAAGHRHDRRVAGAARSRCQGLPVRIGSQRAGDDQGGQPQSHDRRLTRAHRRARHLNRGRARRVAGGRWCSTPTKRTIRVERRGRVHSAT